MSSLVAEKYGYALFEVAKEENRLRDFVKEGKAVLGLFSENPMLSRFLEHPNVRKEEKKELLTKVFKGRISDEFLNLLYITVDKKRTRNIGEIIEEFFALYYESQNIRTGTVITSLPMSEEQMAELKTVLEKKMGGTVHLDNKTDPTILGGIILEMDGKRIDNSLSHELKQLKFRIKEASY